MKKLIIILISLLICASTTYGQWSSDPKQNLLLSNLHIYDVDYKVHTNGDVYIYYTTPTENNIQSYLQILNKKGEKKFSENGLLISNKKTMSWTVVNNYLLIDNEGNAIITVQDCRNDDSDGHRLNYNAYKISPSGEFLWGENGIDLGRGESARLEASMSLLQVGEEYMFAWQRFEDESNAITSSTDMMMMKAGNYEELPITSSATKANAESYIVMERLDKNGNFVGETKYLKDNSIPYAYPWLRNATNGQVILVYAKGTNQDLMARKLDFDGSSVWAQDATIYRGGFGTIPIWTFVQVYEDPDGGVFVSWHDDRNFTNIESAYLSYIKPDGTYGYAAGIEGQKLGFSGFRQFTPYMVYNPTDKSTYIAWRETSDGQGWQSLRAQRLTKEGDLMWDIEGVEILPLVQRPIGYFSCELDKQNRMATFFMAQDSLEAYGNTQAFACLLDTKGQYAWGDATKYAFITNAKSEKGELMSSPAIEDQWILLWSDTRGATGSNQTYLYGQNMYMDGSLTNTVSNEIPLHNTKNDLYIAQNPINDKAQFLVKIQETNKVNLTIYNNLGQKMTTLFDGQLSSGTHEFSWNTNRKGMYIAVLNTNGNISHLKIINQ